LPKNHQEPNNFWNKGQNTGMKNQSMKGWVVYKIKGDENEFTCTEKIFLQKG